MQTLVCRSVAAALGVVALTVSLAVVSAPSLADGVINTTNAFIEAGASGPGVTIDACAPIVPLPDLPELGSMAAQEGFSDPLPALPSTGSGAMGAFSANTNTVLAGGTYEYTSYTVTDGALVSYQGAVTILVTGDVTLSGRMFSENSGASITVVAGGKFETLGLDGVPVTGVRTTGFNAPITIDAGTAIDLATNIVADGSPSNIQSEVAALRGDITLRAHGASSAADHGIDAFQARLAADDGGVTMAAETFVALDQCDVDSTLGEIVLRAHSDAVDVAATDLRGEIGNVVIEAATGVTMNATQVTASAADMRLAALGGDVRVDGQSMLRATDGLSIGFTPAGIGQVDVSASSNVVIENASGIQTDGSGGILVSAHGGDVRLEAGGAFAQSFLEDQKSGTIRIEASNSVRMGGESFISADAGPVEIRAFTGDFTQFGETFVRSQDNDIDARAANLIGASAGVVTAGPNPYFQGSEILLRAGPAGIDLSVDFASAEDGPLLMFADGDVMLRGSFTAADDLVVQTLDGDIDAVGSFINTVTNGDRSGDLVLESFGGSDASIDVRDASIETADAENETGGIRLIVHALGGPSIDAFVLPKAVKVKIDSKKSEKSFLRVSGFFDTGIEPVTFGGPATLTIGDQEFQEDLVPLGKVFGVQRDDFLFKVKPSKAGSSKTKFTILLKGGTGGIDEQGGLLTLRFQTAGVDGQGTVRIENGKYKLGKRRGALIDPSLFPFNVKATHKGPGKDKLVFKVGIATDAPPPATAPDVTIRYGDGLTVTVPGSEFTKKGDNFIAKKPPSAPNVSKLVVNLVREVLEFRASKLDLGALPGGPNVKTIGVTLGEEANSVSVRMAPVAKLKANRY